MKIKEMSSGDNEIILMVKRIEERKTRAGKPFLIMELTDGTSNIKAKLWDTNKEMFRYQSGVVLFCNIKVSEYEGQPDYTVNDYRLADESEASIKDFIKLPPFGCDVMYQDIMQRIERIKNHEVRTVVKSIYQDYKEQILRWSAAVNVHHNFYGGLLYHTYRMMYSAINICCIYTSADESYVVGGCLLHDIGKLLSMNTDDFGNATFTVDGNMYEHLYLGAELLESYLCKYNISQKVGRNLKHIILSHHGEPEYGAVARPCTLEAFLVSQLDNLDSKAYIFEETMNNMDSGTFTENKVFGLNAHVFKN